MHAFIMVVFSYVVGVIASGPMVFLVDRTVNKHRVHFFSVFGVGEHDANELSLGTN